MLSNKYIKNKTIKIWGATSIALVVAMPLHKPIELLVPLPWGLLQAIQAFNQPAYKFFFPFDWKTFQLLHVDLLL
jgi:hypothetical protein